jgi:ribosomal-protein-alanine N-acetyltransferase
MHVLDESEITRIGVFPRFRRQGIADSLICAAREALAALGVHEINLEVRRGNLSAQALYRKHGFAEVGCRKNYYQKENEDAILMKLIF